VELIPIKPEQHQVVLVPKATTDLPFFYHTKKKSLLARNINYEGIDPFGRPIKWRTIPNRDPEIGAPGIDAHDVWMRLVKPTIDLRLDLYDESTYIVPLGGCRKSLRMVGWGEGGFQARRLLRALNQIGSTNIVADIWIPTTETDEKGEPLFQPIKASFTKMSIYAVGSTHLTQEQLQAGHFDFDFDLDDTIYVQLHPIEARIQKSQPQRYIDNQYLFSVSPAAQRWYELVAAKIYGVIKNKGQFCEVRYSWYIKHHHTLKRHYERRRVVQQIKEVIHDHLRSMYLDKVEFIVVREPGQEIDWVIRFYPGDAARASINRILKHTANSRQSRPKPQTQKHKGDAPQLDSARSTESSRNIDRGLFIELTKRGITATQAWNLLSIIETDQAVMDQLEWADYIVSQGGIKNPPGLYVTFIKDNLIPPDSFETSRKRRLKQAQAQALSESQQEKEALQSAYGEYRNKQIDQYIAENPEDYERFYLQKTQEAKEKFNGFDTWKPEMAEKFITVLARAEVAKRITLYNLETFRTLQSSALVRLPNLLPPLLLALPAPRQGSHLQDSSDPPTDALPTQGTDPSPAPDIPYIVV
jgi:hypothetical protein